MDTDKIYAEHIANEYSLKQTTKVIQLKKLDAKAKRPAKVFSFIFGIGSTLILGIGMCLSMKVIGDTLISMILGICIGVIGIIGCCINFPIYKVLLKKGKEKYGSDIIRLAKEISED